MGGWPANILETIGWTPLVRINRLSENELYAKLEGRNPGGSIKDRPVQKMIEAAEKLDLIKNRIVIEASSGNTGIALAMIGAVRGYQIEIVMPENASLERRKAMTAFGAKITLTPAELGIDGAINLANKKLEKNPEKYFMPDQYSNENNPLAHYAQTANEIWEQTDGEIRAFVSGIGTGGTVMGVGKLLREKNPEIKIIAAEPYPNHKIQGLKNMQTSIVPKIFNRKEVDEIIYVSDNDAFETARNLAKKEGILVGISSGASMWAAIQTAKKIKGIVISLLPDNGERYFTTELFQ
ncbi:MAG: cysteine synthase [Candidatus Micrarchaeota archaeon]